MIDGEREMEKERDFFVVVCSPRALHDSDYCNDKDHNENNNK